MLSRDSILILMLVCGAIAVPNEELTVEEAFKKYMIVPTFLSRAPLTELFVRYNNIVVNLGNEIPGFITHFPPYISYEAQPNSLYSLVFLDLDSPSNVAPLDSPFLNLLVLNIPGANITAGDYVTSLIPPAPYPGSGYHRFLYLVFKQVSSIAVTPERIIRVRNNLENFALSEFITRYRLGTAIAGNFFTSQLDVCGNGLKDRIKKTCKGF